MALMTRADGGGDARRRRVQNAIRACALVRPPRFDYSLEAYMTYRIGGPAWAFVEPVNARELQRVLAVARDAATLALVVGVGSNLLVRDGGVPGIAICFAGAFDTFVDVFLNCGGAGR